MQRKNWFTLMEMLIVIVIIWILGAAILPRLTWYLAKTRDLKRQMDLRTIATAVESYKNQHGEFPVMKGNKNEKNQRFANWVDRPHQWSTKYLKEALSEYLKEIPQDPNKTQDLRFMEYWCRDYYRASGRKKSIICDNEWPVEKGDYFYFLPKVGEKSRRAILIAKVETPDAANYVGRWFLKWWFLKTSNPIYQKVSRENITRYFCTEITK